MVAGEGGEGLVLVRRRFVARIVGGVSGERGMDWDWKVYMFAEAVVFVE